MLSYLSIITITYNNPDELQKTYESLIEFREKGGKHVVINGGLSVHQFIGKDTLLIEESDIGIYDALNKGVSHVTSPFFMLIHSGDTLVVPTLDLENQLRIMNENQLDLLLNDCSIEFGKKKRLLRSKWWRPWMFSFGAQPAHPPCIYKTASVNKIKYDDTLKIVADFKYLEDLFKSNVNYGYGNKLLIHMNSGGETSSGLISFIKVSKEFIKLKGPLKGILFILSRVFIKVLQML